MRQSAGVSAYRYRHRRRFPKELNNFFNESHICLLSILSKRALTKNRIYFIKAHDLFAVKTLFHKRRARRDAGCVMWYNKYMNWQKMLKSLMAFSVAALLLLAGAFYALDALRVARGLKPVVLKPLGGVTSVSDNKTGVIYKNTHDDTSATQSDLHADLIRVATPLPHATIKSPLIVQGEARGKWFFEASFPVRLLDETEKEIAIGIAQAGGDWMTEKFVPFTATLRFQEPGTGSGTLVLEKDNPSGVPEYADALRIPVVFSEQGIQ